MLYPLHYESQMKIWLLQKWPQLLPQLAKCHAMRPAPVVQVRNTNIAMGKFERGRPEKSKNPEKKMVKYVKEL